MIISAGWTIGPVEVENTLLNHPDVHEAAVIGIPDRLRGQIVKAFVVSYRKDEHFRKELKAFVKVGLSAHAYPREIAFVESLPKTPAGKVNRKALREQAIGVMVKV